MDQTELLRRVRQIQIRASRSVNDVLAGEYSSVFKGRGMEFDEVREYVPGDDVRLIDWNVTARTGRPHIKRFVEERELTVMLLVDLSSSVKFGTVRQLKSEAIVEICALLALSAIQNNDKVGLIIFTEGIERYVPPKKGKTHVLRVIRELLHHEAKRARTDIAGALEYLLRVMRRRCVAFLVSDFLADQAAFERPIKLAGKKHDLIAITVGDPREVDVPPVGILELEDAETGEIILVDTSSRALRTSFHDRSGSEMRGRHDLLRRADIDHIEVFMDKPYLDALVRFFRMRERRLGVL
jgi:uncharacterized protein (DUF58 family)